MDMTKRDMVVGIGMHHIIQLVLHNDWKRTKGANILTINQGWGPLG